MGSITLVNFVPQRRLWYSKSMGIGPNLSPYYLSGDEMETRVCSRCEKEFPLTDEFFKKTKLMVCGFYKTCKKCCAQYKPGYGRNAQMKSRYGLTPQQYDNKLSEQNGICTLCGADPTVQERRFSVDHDHECCSGQRSCGKCVRDIICANCNRKVGFLEAILREGTITPLANTWLSKALDYLSYWRSVHHGPNA